MDFFAEYGLFLLKSITLVFSLLFLVAGLFAVSRKKPRPRLEVISLNKQFDSLRKTIQKETGDKKPVKEKKSKEKKPDLYVLDFVGDMKASQVTQLREEVSAVLSLATKQDEVLIRLESPGGAVNGYGLAASQLARFRDKKIPLTVCIDTVAASGGYLMACVANRIVAAPFAIIGSIGVVAQIPNFYRWLKNHNIDVELLTAGEYKRTLTLFAENTEKGRKKFQQDLEQIHETFKSYVLNYRQDLDMEQVATGEHWLAKDAQELRLVDELKTSDEYLIEKMSKFNCYQIRIQAKETFISKLMKPAMKILHPWA